MTKLRSSTNQPSPINEHTPQLVAPQSNGAGNHHINGSAANGASNGGVGVNGMISSSSYEPSSDESSGYAGRSRFKRSSEICQNNTNSSIRGPKSEWSVRADTLCFFPIGRLPCWATFAKSSQRLQLPARPHPRRPITGVPGEVPRTATASWTWPTRQATPLCSATGSASTAHLQTGVHESNPPKAAKCLSAGCPETSLSRSWSLSLKRWNFLLLMYLTGLVVFNQAFVL